MCVLSISTKLDEIHKNTRKKIFNEFRHFLIFPEGENERKTRITAQTTKKGEIIGNLTPKLSNLVPEKSLKTA